MVTASEILGGIRQREQQLTEARTGVQAFDPRVLQTQQQLRATTMLKQVGVREAETMRREAKQRAAEEVAAMEAEFARQKVQLAPQIEALQKQEAYERGVEIARKGAMPVGLSRWERKGYTDYMKSQVKPVVEAIDIARVEGGLQITKPEGKVEGESKPFFTIKPTVKDVLLVQAIKKYKPDLSKVAVSAYESLKKIPGAKLLFGEETKETKEVIPEKVTYTVLDWKGEPVKTYEAAPLPEQIPKYTPYKLPVTTIPSFFAKGVSKVAEMSGKGYEAALTRVGYKGIPYRVDVGGKTYEQRAFTPSGIGRAVTLAGEAGAYTAPYLGTAMLVSSAARGIEGARAPIPTKLPTELEIKPEPPPQVLKPEAFQKGMIKEEYDAYVKQIEQANKENKTAYEEYTKQVEQANKETLSQYQQSVKAQKVMGVVEAGLSIGFLGYKGYKAATKPYVVSTPLKQPIVAAEAKVTPRAGRVEILSVEPGQEYIRTTPLKEALFFGSGKRIDLAKQFITPTQVRYTEVFLLKTPREAVGVGAGYKVGKITQREALYLGVEPPLKVNYFELVKQAPPKTIKPFELKALRTKADLSMLTPTEAKIVKTIQMEVLKRPVMRATVTGEPDWYRSVVKQTPLKVTRLEGYTGKGEFVLTREYETLPFKIPAPKVEKASVQFFRVAKPYSVGVSERGAITEQYQIFVGAKGIEAKGIGKFVGFTPFTPRGKIQIIPMKVEVVSRVGGEVSGTILGRVTKKVITKPPIQLTEQLVKQSTKTAETLGKIQTASEVARAIAKKPFPSLIPKLVTKQETITKVLPALSLVPSQVEVPRLVPKEVSKLEISTRQIEVPKIIEVPKLETPTIETFGSPTKQVETVKLIEVPKLELVTIPVMEVPKPMFPAPAVPRVEPLRPPRTPVIPLPKTIKTKTKLPVPKREELFVPFIKRRGQFFAISKPRPYKVATRKGISALRRTLAASLQIRKAKTGVAIKFEAVPKGFRFGLAGKEPTILVQKRRERLGTYGERAEIVRARRIKFFK